MIVVGFDVDGTLDTAGGPVGWAKVQALQFSGVAIGIVSPSANRPRDGTPAYLPGDGTDRVANLRALAAQYPEARFRLYVSDNPGDETLAAWAGFALLRPAAFAEGLAQ